jgi:RimJ/RimL family protein N-acetyltransferase
MSFTFSPMNKADAETIATWEYEGPYRVYSATQDSRELVEQELLDPRSPYFAVRNESSDLVGFFCFGTAAQVGGERGTPSLFGPDGCVTVGLGMHPHLTGRGLGLSFVEAGLDFARTAYTPTSFRLFVLAWNKRATRVYERAGFVPIGRVWQGEDEFVEMSRAA